MFLHLKIFGKFKDFQSLDFKINQMNFKIKSMDSCKSTKWIYYDKVIKYKNINFIFLLFHISHVLNFLLHIEYLHIFVYMIVLNWLMLHVLILGYKNLFIIIISYIEFFSSSTSFFFGFFVKKNEILKYNFFLDWKHVYIKNNGYRIENIKVGLGRIWIVL